jgi:hypothetical protein
MENPELAEAAAAISWSPFLAQDLSISKGENCVVFGSPTDLAFFRFTISGRGGISAYRTKSLVSRSLAATRRNRYTPLSTSPGGAAATRVGDFNSNSQWDDNRPERNHTEVVRLFGCHDLISAYHRHYGEKHGEKQGAETRPTYYFYRHQDKPFHIDYVFVPKGWRLKSVEVGSFQKWGNLSDHVPVVVDVSIGGGGYGHVHRSAVGLNGVDLIAVRRDELPPPRVPACWGRS